MGVMRPDRSGRLAPADVVDLLDEISALLREQGGNQALELSLRDLSMSLQAIQDQLSRAQKTATPTDPTSLVAPLVDRITDALGALADLPAPQVALPDRLTADLSPKAVELLQGLAPKQDGDVLAKMVEKLEALDFRMKGGKAFGSSGPSNIADNPSRELGRVTTVGGDKVSTETTLASVLSDLQGKRNGTGAEPVYISSSVAAKVGEGKFFIADSGQVATTVTNNWINLTFTNPAGSGKTAYLVAITVESDQTSTWAKFYRSPTTGTPTTARTAYNGINLLSTGPYAATCQVKGDPLATEMDGATTLVTRVTSNVSMKLELPPMVVTEGTTLGFGANLGGAGNGSVAVYWFEE